LWELAGAATVRLTRPRRRAVKPHGAVGNSEPSAVRRQRVAVARAVWQFW